MWVITLYSKDNITMFEFDTEEEGREAFENIQGCKILSEILYFNDPYYFGVVPIIAQTATAYGVDPVEIARAPLFLDNQSMR
jgi:hypothetical protein